MRRDETEVVEVEPATRLVVLAKARPFGVARVDVRLAADGTGTRVTMDEVPVSGPGRWVHNPAADAVLKRRNVEALARLSALAERRERPLD